MKEPRRLTDRRQFMTDVLRCAGCGMLVSALPGAALVAGSRSAHAQQDQAGALSYDIEQTFPPVEARYYKKLDAKRVECHLCPNHCRVADLERGTCGVRENRSGTYFALNYARAVSANVDPIEKKPLFHFMPGTTAFSIATAGCNLECKFCQNWQISQFRPEQVQAIHLGPEDVHVYARHYDAPTIAYTYSEPTIYYEYMVDTARLGVKTGIRSVMISAGFIEQEPLKDLLPHLAAVKIDLKSFRQQFYDRECRGQLKVVLRSLETIRAAGKWLELVVLVVPTMNDSEQEAREMSQWVKANLGPDVPMHFTRFHPTYRLHNLPPTPVATIERCRDIAMAEGMNFVYLGNVSGHPAENTYCPKCHEVVIERMGMSVKQNRLQSGHCSKCHASIPGVWV